MPAISHELTRTGAAGLAAYGLATALCGVAWARARSDGPQSRIAALSTILEGSLLLDLIFNLRWKLHDLFADLALHLNLYKDRRAPQALALGLLTMLICWGLLSISRLIRERPGAFLAVAGILLSLLLWCTEVISLHAVDQILYHTVGPLTVVGLFRLLTCLITVTGILIDGRAAEKSTRVRQF